MFESNTAHRCKDNFLTEGKTFDSEIFESVAINLVDGIEAKFKNCSFNNCRISHGSFQLGKNVTLESVVFNSIEVSGELDIHSGTKISNSKFISSNPEDMLWKKIFWGIPSVTLMQSNWIFQSFMAMLSLPAMMFREL